jgi:hypothetical protein
MWLGSEIRGNKWEADAISWEKTAMKLRAELAKANAYTVDAASSRDALRQLVLAILAELKDPAHPRMLSDPENQPARQRLFDAAKAKSKSAMQQKCQN